MRPLALVLALAACGDNARSTAPDSTPQPDGPPAPGPNVVKLSYFGTPNLLAYRDGSGPWLEPDPPDAMGNYALHVTNAYEVVAVCSPPSIVGDFDAEQLNATAGDGDQYLFCQVGGGPPPATVAVTGMMNQAGTVSMSDSKSSPTGPWSFALNVEPGSHDLLAFGGGKLLLHRDQMITTATTIPTIDLATDGMAMGLVTLSVAGRLSGDQVQTDLDWFTAHDYATVSSTSNLKVALPPASLVQANDSVQLSIQDTGSSGLAFRGVGVTGYDGSSTSFTLPPVLTGITYTTPSNHLTVSLGSLPTYTSVELTAFGGGSSFQIQNVQATRAWVTATGATTLAFDTSAPRYIAGWNIDVTHSYFRAVAVLDHEGSATYISERGEAAGVVAAQAQVERMVRERLVKRHTRWTAR